MPYAQLHYPFENQEVFEGRLPGRVHRRGARPDPRLVLHPDRAGAALFDKPAFRNVIVNGMVMAEDGKKMSKRLTQLHAAGRADGDLRCRRAAALPHQLGPGAWRGAALRGCGRARHDRRALLPWYNAFSFLKTYAPIDAGRLRRVCTRRQRAGSVAAVAAADAEGQRRARDGGVPALQRGAAAVRLHRRSHQLVHPAQSLAVLG